MNMTRPCTYFMWPTKSWMYLPWKVCHLGGPGVRVRPLEEAPQQYIKWWNWATDHFSVNPLAITLEYFSDYKCKWVASPGFVQWLMYISFTYWSCTNVLYISDLCMISPRLTFLGVISLIFLHAVRFMYCTYSGYNTYRHPNIVLVPDHNPSSLL